MEQVGKVVQIIGPVVDCEFEEKHLPQIYNCVIVEGEAEGQAIHVSAEVQQHLGENRVRCVSMQRTDGMVRGMKAIDTGQPISVPVGRETLGRVMNVMGKPVDELGELQDPSSTRFTASRPALKNRAPKPRCLKRESRLSIFWHPMFLAERSGYSAAPASAKQSSSWK
jgi:F-type H+-transporting ATPase subunit beta